MKKLVLLLSIVLSVQAFAQKDPYGLVVTDSDMEKFSDYTKERMKESSDAICACIKEHQEPYDAFNEYVMRATKAKQNKDEKELEKTTAQANDMVMSIIPFVNCMGEKRKSMPEIEDKEAHDKEFIAAFPDYDTSGENLEVAKMRVGVYFIENNCKGEGEKFNLFSAFMNGLSKGMKK